MVSNDYTAIFNLQTQADSAAKPVVSKRLTCDIQLADPSWFGSAKQIEWMGSSWEEFTLMTGRRVEEMSGFKEVKTEIFGYSVNSFALPVTVR